MAEPTGDGGDGFRRADDVVINEEFVKAPASRAEVFMVGSAIRQLVLLHSKIDVHLAVGEVEEAKAIMSQVWTLGRRLDYLLDCLLTGEPMR